MTTSFCAVLDACVLVPMTLCDTLLSLADQRLYRPLWSYMILDEMERNATKVMITNGMTAEVAAEGAAYRRSEMEANYPEALVKGYESLISVMTNDEKDRHVLAAAERGSAQLIVTNNTRDFPRSALDPYNIERKTADEFLIDLLGFDSHLVISAIQAMTAQKTRPPMTKLEMLQRIAKSAPNFASAVLVHLES